MHACYASRNISKSHLASVQCLAPRPRDTSNISLGMHRLHSTTLQRQRRHSIQRPGHLIRRHLAILQTPDLASLTQTLQAESEFPALTIVDEEQVFLAVCVADRGAEDVQAFGGLDAGLFSELV
jgi:hypothetical protein